MDDILIKPVNLVDLMGRLDQWLPLPAGTELPAPAQRGGADVLDRSVLDAITGGDPGVERDVLLDLRQVNEADMGLLRQSLHGTDLEQATRADDFAAVKEGFARLEAEMAALHERIDSLTVPARVGAGG